MIKNYFNNISIKKKIIITMLLVALIPLTSLGIFSTKYVTDTVLTMKSDYLQGALDQLNIITFLKFKNIDDISKTVLGRPVVNQILMQENQGDYQNDFQDTELIEKELKSISLSNNYITSIYLLPEYYHKIFAVGDVVASYNTSYFDESFKHYKDLDLYQNTITDVINYKWWPVETVQGKKVFVLSRKLYDIEKGNLGVVIIHVDTRLLRDIYKQIELETGSELYLVSKEGMVLYTNNEDQIQEQFYDQNILSRITKDDTGSFRMNMKRNNTEDDVMVFYNTLMIADWKIFVITPYNNVIKESSLIKSVSFAYLGVSLILILIVANFGSVYIVKPILDLVDKMKKGSKGALTIRVNEERKDEIGILGTTFNRMMHDINQLIIDVESEQQQRIDAEIRVLEAHINPHFLYNTLTSIYWTAIADGNQTIADIASSLSNYFRLGLNRGKEFTSVKNEISHVREYLQIQKMRFSNKLEFYIEYETSLNEYLTIKLLLQPLVENAIVHGFDDMKDKGEIHIKAFEEQGYLNFVVQDNGKGIKDSSEEVISHLIDHGYGLKNIKQRLALYYDNDYAFNIKSDESGTIVFIKIPLKTE